MIKDSLLEKKLLHYTRKAIADFNMIRRGDRVMVYFSGEVECFALLRILNLLKQRGRRQFDLIIYSFDRSFAEKEQWEQWLFNNKICNNVVKWNGNENDILTNLYAYAKNNQINKIALKHHRDDLIRSLFLSIFYEGQIKSLPPKCISDDKNSIVIRPFVFCQEKDIIQYAKECAFPIETYANSTINNNDLRIRDLINQLINENPKIPSNMLHALTKVSLSQLMDSTHWNFRNLEMQS